MNKNALIEIGFVNWFIRLNAVARCRPRDRVFGDNRTAVHYVKDIIGGETEIEVLLDEEDADFSFLFAL